MKITQKLKTVVEAITHEFGWTKTAVVCMSTLIGTGVGFVIPAAIMPNHPIINEAVEETTESTN